MHIKDLNYSMSNMATLFQLSDEMEDPDVSVLTEPNNLDTNQRGLNLDAVNGASSTRNNTQRNLNPTSQPSSSPSSQLTGQPRHQHRNRNTQRRRFRTGKRNRGNSSIRDPPPNANPIAYQTSSNYPNSESLTMHHGSRSPTWNRGSRNSHYPPRGTAVESVDCFQNSRDPPCANVGIGSSRSLSVGYNRIDNSNDFPSSLSGLSSHSHCTSLNRSNIGGRGSLSNGSSSSKASRIPPPLYHLSPFDSSQSSTRRDLYAESSSRKRSKNNHW